MITTFAGRGVFSPERGDNMLATDVAIGDPYDVVVDDKGTSDVGDDEVLFLGHIAGRVLWCVMWIVLVILLWWWVGVCRLLLVLMLILLFLSQRWK